MKKFRCWYVYAKPTLIQAANEEAAKAEAMRMWRCGYPFKIARCEEIMLEEKCI